MPIERSSFTECCVGFVFNSPARRNVRQQGEMDVDDVSRPQFVAELADRLEKRQALDVADRAADLDDDEIDALVAGAE